MSTTKKKVNTLKELITSIPSRRRRRSQLSSNGVVLKYNHLLNAELAKLCSSNVTFYQILDELENLVSEQAKLFSKTPNYKLKNISKMIKLLEELSVYFLGNFLQDDTNKQSQLWKILQTLYSFNLQDEKLTFLIQYFSVNFLPLNGSDLESFLVILKKQMVNENTFEVKSLSIKTLSRVYQRNFKQLVTNTLLDEKITSSLKENVSKSTSAKKNKLKSLFKIVDKDIKAVNDFLQAVVSSLLHNTLCVKLNAEFPLNDIVTVTRNKQKGCARDAINCLNELCEVRGKKEEILKLIKPILPVWTLEKAVIGLELKYDEDLKKSKNSTYYEKINAQTPFSKIYLARLCSHAITEVLEVKNGEKWEKFVECLKYLFYDSSDLVFVECVKIFCNKNFGLFLEKDSEGKNIILGNVILRICKLLKSSSQIDLHSACRISQILFEGLEKFRMKNEDKITKDLKTMIQTLIETLYGLYKYDCYNVKLQLFKCLFWIPYNHDELKNILLRLKLSIRPNLIWETYHYFEIMNSILDRIKYNSDMVNYLIDYCYFLCIEYPERVDINYLMNFFNRLSEYPVVGEYFLKLLFNLLDNCFKGSKYSQNIAFCVMNFLGENANLITGEILHVITDEKNEITQTNDDNSIKQSYEDNESFDIQNQAMKSIVLRLIQGSLYNITPLRICCIEALGKIAFRSYDSIRFFIYQFLFNVNESSEDYSISEYCNNFFTILNETYDLEKDFYELSAMTKKPAEKMSEFFKKHEEIKEKMKFYCHLPKNFLPLGSKSNEFVKESQIISEL